MPRPSVYPTIKWKANNKALLHELFNVLDKNDAICRDICRRKDNFSSGVTKTTHY